MKKLGILLIIFLLLNLGCININPNESESILKLREKYLVDSSLSPNQEVLTAYINALILENKSSNFYYAELYTTQSFYYVIVSMEQAANIEVNSSNCRSPYLIRAYQAAILAEKTATNALIKIDSLNQTEQDMLRINQKELVNEYLINAKEIKDEIKNNCPSIN